MKVIKLEDARIVYENSTVVVKTDNISATLLENGELNFKQDVSTEQKEALKNWLETWGYNVGFSGRIGFHLRYKKAVIASSTSKVRDKTKNLVRKYWFKGVDAAIFCSNGECSLCIRHG